MIERNKMSNITLGDRARSSSSFMAVYAGSIMIFLLSCFQCDYVHGAEEGYTIQLGAYRDARAAEEKVNELKRLGHNAIFQKEMIQGKGVWYRVYIERFSSKEAAEKEARILRELGLISAYIVRSLPSEKEGERDSGEKDRSAYYLRVGAFKKQENAENLVQDILREGQKATRVREEVSGEKWFRVYVGGYDKEAEANNVGAQLKAKGLISGFITLFMNTEPSVGSVKESKP